MSTQPLHQPGLRWFLPFRLATYVILLAVVVLWLHNPGSAQVLFVIYSLLTLGMALATALADRIRRPLLSTTIITAQFVAEIAIESFIVYSSGGINSPYLGLFLLSIVSAALVYQLVGTLVVASAVAAAYSLAVWLGQLGDIAGQGEGIGRLWVTENSTLYSLLLHVLIFYLVAFISGMLAHRLRLQEEQLANTSLALKRARLETDDILRHLNSGLLTIDHVGTIIYFNRTAERILGYSEDQIRGLTCEQVFGQRMPLLAVCLMDGINHGVEHPRREIEIVDNQGRVVPVGLSTSILRDENRWPRGVIGIFSDLTNAKEMEEKIRIADRLAAVGELSASIAHEIRNPLAAISGSVEVLRADLKVSGANERLMTLIVKESHRLSRVLTDFLTYARIGRTSYGRVELCHLAGEVLQIVRHHESYKPSFAVSLDSREAFVYVMGDDDLIKQLMVNLIINACEAVGDGPGRIRLVVTPTKSGRVVLEVSDNGPGIEPEHLSRIFEPFYSTKKRGTGLGLAIVHRICSLLKLSISVDSRLGHGTTFRVEFPASDGVSDKPAPVIPSIPQSVSAQ